MAGCAAKGIERRIALVVPGYIEALHVAARTDLVAFVPRRLIARAGEAIVAGDGDAAVRSRDRRAIHVLSDPRPDGPRLDLAAQADAGNRPRAGSAEPQGRVAIPSVVPAQGRDDSNLPQRFSSARTFCTAGRCSMRRRCANTFGKRRDIDAVAFEPETERIEIGIADRVLYRPSPRAPSACRARSARSMAPTVFGIMRFMSAKEASSVAQR